MRVSGYEDIDRFLALREENEDSEEDLLVLEYVISNDQDFRGLRILLLHNLLDSQARIIHQGKNQFLFQWIESNPEKINLIYAYIDSTYFDLEQLNDNQLLYFTRLMIYNIQAYGYLLQKIRDLYRGEDTQEIFTKYDLTLEDLIEVKQRCGLEIDFERDHIIAELSSRPDRYILTLNI